MVLILISYLGGVLTILSPCILPVIPFVFARADQPFRKSGLPLLLGMAITFAAFSSLAVLGSTWAVSANSWGRTLALVLMTVFGLSLLFPNFFERLFEPFARLGARLTARPSTETSFARSMVLGAATGMLWAPCAGPILGLILTGAATQGSAQQAVWFLLAYALGAATSLMLALVAGGKFLATLKKSLRAERRIKAGLGIAVLLGVVAISLNLDRTLLTKISGVETATLENHILNTLSPDSEAAQSNMTLEPIEQLQPSLAGATKWLNSEALSFESLKGKVVLIDFWTYSCINCLRTLPYVKAWNDKYKDQGLVIIGVHTPEFAFEKEPDNVAKALTDLGITYPVAMDNNYGIWNSFQNRYWPAHYFFDRKGVLRHHHFGEGSYENSELVIQQLLNEGEAKKSKAPLVQVQGQGAMAAPLSASVQSPETYIGYSRLENFRSQTVIKTDHEEKYMGANNLNLNEWSLDGPWNVHAEKATSSVAGSKIIFRFHARDLHLVLGPQKDGVSIPFRVKIDGKQPGAHHGMDINAQGEGTVTDHRLYQLIRQSDLRDSQIEDHTFEIEFLKPGAEAFAFTFG
jgi:cytochrome c biogenesis protein CcdA/thiol-disulfide isomerase/thioredoxin